MEIDPGHEEIKKYYKNHRNSGQRVAIIENLAAKLFASGCKSMKVFIKSIIHCLIV